MRTTIRGSFVLVAALALAAPANAQTRMVTGETNVSEAMQLEAQAAALYQAPSKYKDAARLHERAAELRPAGDVKRVDNLVQAARLWYYAGAQSRAREVMVRAGDGALAAGDVVTAATTYLDAAFLYRDAGQPAEANRLIQKAQLLSNSPQITSSDRDDILRRIQVSA
jgi:tetratricopeptide (TPR) repeat protein